MSVYADTPASTMTRISAHCVRVHQTGQTASPQDENRMLIWPARVIRIAHLRAAGALRATPWNPWISTGISRTYARSALRFLLSAPVSFWSALVFLPSAPAFIRSAPRFLASALTFFRSALRFLASAPTFFRSAPRFLVSAPAFFRSAPRFLVPAPAFFRSALAFLPSALTYFRSAPEFPTRHVESSRTARCMACPGHALACDPASRPRQAASQALPHGIRMLSRNT
jgi:hypothetical protein